MISIDHINTFKKIVLSHIKKNDFSGTWEHARLEARVSERWVADDYQPRISITKLVKTRSVSIDHPMTTIIRLSQPPFALPGGLEFDGQPIQWREPAEPIGSIDNQDVFYLPFPRAFVWSPSPDYPESVTCWLCWPAMPKGWD